MANASPTSHTAERRAAKAAARADCAPYDLARGQFAQFEGHRHDRFAIDADLVAPFFDGPGQDILRMLRARPVQTALEVRLRGRIERIAAIGGEHRVDLRNAGRAQRVRSDRLSRAAGVGRLGEVRERQHSNGPIFRERGRRCRFDTGACADDEPAGDGEQQARGPGDTLDCSHVRSSSSFVDFRQRRASLRRPSVQYSQRYRAPITVTAEPVCATR